MAQRSIRFGVSDGKELCAATWKLWTETAGGNSEIYLACRSLGGELKASMHQSGEWHVSFSKKTYHEKVEGYIPSLKSRFTEKWSRPREIAPGFTLAYRIVTPYSAVCGSRLFGKFNKVKWVPCAPKLKATEIDILITKPAVQTSGWPGKQSMGTSLIGSFGLSNGDTVWAVYWLIDMPDFSRMPCGHGHYFNGQTKENLKTIGLRALVFGDEPDGSKVIYDLAAQDNNS